jgi:hypothetical protein
MSALSQPGQDCGAFHWPRRRLVLLECCGLIVVTAEVDVGEGNNGTFIADAEFEIHALVHGG